MSFKTMDCLRNLGFVEGRNEAGFACLVYNEGGKILYATEQVGLYLRPEVWGKLKKSDTNVKNPN